jgi:hypothetical protein
MNTGLRWGTERTENVPITQDKICKDLLPRIIDHIHGKAAKEYWKKKLSLELDDTDLVATGKAMNGVALSQCHWASKQASGFCATNKTLKQRNKLDFDECPRCQAPEDEVRILQCQDPASKALWQKASKTSRCGCKRNKRNLILLISSARASYNGNQTRNSLQFRACSLTYRQRWTAKIHWAGYISSMGSRQTTGKQLKNVTYNG